MEILIYLFFKRIGEEFISLIQLVHTVSTECGHVERHAACGGDLLGCGEAEGMEDTGGAEQADGERIGLLFRFPFAGKLLDARILCIFEVMTEEDVAELMGKGEAADGDGLGIVVYDDPIAAVGEGSAFFLPRELMDEAIADDVDIGSAGNAKNVYGKAGDVEI